MPIKNPTHKQREDIRAYDRKWYQANKEKRLAITRRWEKENFKRYNDYKKTQKCQHCGESDYLVLQFHHIDPSTKDVEVSVLVRNHSFEKVMNEINKCMVLCANCHIREHHRKKYA